MTEDNGLVLCRTGRIDAIQAGHDYRDLALGLSRRRQAGQTGSQNFGVSLKVQGLQTAARAGLDPHCAGGHVQRLREQSDKRRIGLAVLGNRAHPRLQNRAAVGKRLKAGDFIAGAFRRQADGQHQTVRAKTPRLLAQDLEDVWINIFLDDALNEENQQQQNHRRNIDAAKIRYDSPDRLE